MLAKWNGVVLGKTRRAGERGTWGCNILTANLIDYDDSVMAGDIERFCVCSRGFHSLDRVAGGPSSFPVLQVCPNEANKSDACHACLPSIYQPGAGICIFFD